MSVMEKEDPPFDGGNVQPEQNEIARQYVEEGTIDNLGPFPNRYEYPFIRTSSTTWPMGVEGPTGPIGPQGAPGIIQTNSDVEVINENDTFIEFV